ncbi:N-acetylmuramoyl-L-alanine amidase [Streptomyces sp. NBC_01474]|uniref:N-acetylmuramoyl-L-alanine amidase n=1 Tax=unclassified Streptomyces TaxID=2593676 RepID=UPI002DDB7443|nr:MULTISPECIES: N-acetylmuramoyl-L-alanine amidase [unclassified Streptomyces]WSD98524.1 N-acetylmuramoyl-L-alanine amidase [Streptomyces sp. NBC_01474]
MSYVGPDSDGYFDGDGDGPRRPRRFSGGPLTVALAALVPTALAGWLIWQVVGGPGENEPAKTLPAASQSSTAGADTTSPSPSKSDDGKKGDGSPSATPSKPKSKPPASSSKPAGSGPLKGKVVVIDPGHNPGNFRHATEINRLVDIGTNRKECDTTGTSTNAGYTEAQFTLDVSRRLRTLLQQQGATVELTQNGDRSWGPCVDERARIGNKAHADAVISVHADGSAAGNRGFHVILPASVHSGSANTTAIAGPSRDLGERVAGNFLRATGSAPSNYIGGGTGLDVRKDLGGLNLSAVPKVFIECGNMRDAKDAALLTSGAWRQKAAQGMSDGIVSFLRG